MICPSVLGLTEVVQTVGFKVERIAQLQASKSGFQALCLALCSIHARRWWEVTLLLCVINKQARGTQVLVWCLLASQPASHQEFFTSWTLASPPPIKACFSSSWVQGGHADGYFLCSPWTSLNKSSSQPLTNMSWFVVSKWGICKKGKS